MFIKDLKIGKKYVFINYITWTMVRFTLKSVNGNFLNISIDKDISNVRYIEGSRTLVVTENPYNVTVPQNKHTLILNSYSFIIPYDKPTIHKVIREHMIQTHQIGKQIRLDKNDRYHSFLFKIKHRI